jgi:cell division control protein 6
MSISRIMILDELEHLSGDALPLLMAVATHTFRIIGISNTHTLTTKPTASTLTLHFKPYTAQEMTDIISKRLATLELPQDTKSLVALPALSFACRKIASQTGDLRAALSLVLSAIELAEKDHIKKVFAHKGDDALPLTPTSMAHVLNASKAATTQAPGTVSVVRQLNLQARLVLLSLILATRRTSASLSLSGPTPQTPNKSKGPKDKGKAKASEVLSSDGLFNFYSRLLSGNDAAFHVVSRSEFADLLGLLETQGLLELSVAAAAGGKGKKSDKAQTVGVPSASREEEMVKGLTVTEEGQMEGPTEREIRTMWTRETGRIKREVEDREMLFKKRKFAFEDAEEA